jgi:hypothetical protein
LPQPVKSRIKKAKNEGERDNDPGAEFRSQKSSNDGQAEIADEVAGSQ